MTKKRRSHPSEQLKIAGTERLDRVPRLDKLAEEFIDLDEQLKGCREGKNDVAEQLVAEMKDRDIDRYVFEDKFGRLQEINIEDLEAKVTIKRVPKRPETVAGPEEARN